MNGYVGKRVMFPMRVFNVIAVSLILSLCLIGCGKFHKGESMKSSLSQEQWRLFLSCWQEGSLAQSPENSSLSGEGRVALARRSLTYAPAQEVEVAICEDKLRQRLPDTYRQFLLTTNGLILPMVDATGTYLLPAKSIDRLVIMRPELAEIITDYTGDGFVYDKEQLVVVSSGFDAGELLLNPLVTDANDEWEAWYLSAHIPGIIKFESFSHLMMYLYLYEKFGVVDVNGSADLLKYKDDSCLSLFKS